ncbi:parotid secretory protein, partial [Cricetulus griseus]
AFTVIGTHRSVLDLTGGRTQEQGFYRGAKLTIMGRSRTFPSSSSTRKSVKLLGLASKSDVTMDGSQRCNAVLHDSLTLIPSTPNKATEITMKQPRLPAYVVEVHGNLEKDVNSKAETEKRPLTKDFIVGNVTSMGNRRLYIFLPVLFATMKINAVRMEDLHSELSSDEIETELMMPLDVNTNVDLPNADPRDKTAYFLRVRCSLTVDLDSQNFPPTGNMWQCQTEITSDIAS